MVVTLHLHELCNDMWCLFYIKPKTISNKISSVRFDLVRLGLSVQFGFRLILLGPTKHYPRLEVHKARAKPDFDLAVVNFWPKKNFPPHIVQSPA